jgi:ABC-type proline/glycine betaine transport system ATPase subunit
VTGRFNSDARGTVRLTAAGQVCPFSPASTCTRRHTPDLAAIALLGPNAAGKTTFISAVATLLRPDGGELSVAGINARAEPRRVHRLIGLTGQSASVESAMTGRENLELVGRLFGLDRRGARSAARAVLGHWTSPMPPTA